MPDSSPEEIVDPPIVVADTDAAETPAKVTDEKPAESSPAKGESMLDVVQAALEPKAATPVAETPETPADTETPETKPTETDEDELSEEDRKNLSEKTQRRFKSLTSKLRDKDERISSLEPKAKELDDLNRYVTEAGLSNNDVAGTLEIAVMLKHNPRGALERLMPVIRQLEQAVGEILPPELQARVDQGFLAPEDAKAQARAVAEARIANQRAERLSQNQQQESARRETQTLIDDSMASADEWEKVQAKSDPDWHLKRKDVAEQVELAILQESARQGRPWFPDKAKLAEFSKTALKTVNERFARFTPKPKAIIPATSGASSRSTPEPKNMLDVVRMTVGAG